MLRGDLESILISLDIYFAFKENKSFSTTATDRGMSQYIQDTLSVHIHISKSCTIKMVLALLIHF